MSRKPIYDRDLVRSLYAAGDSREQIAVKLAYPLNTVKKILANGGKGQRLGTGKPRIPVQDPESEPWDEQASVTAVALLAKNGILEGPALVACVRKIEQLIKAKVPSMKQKELGAAHS